MFQQSQNNYLTLIIGLVAVAQCGFALYLPSLPAITHAFHADPSAVQSTVFLYVLGISISQWFYGPASDYYGRRCIALFGLCLFIGGAILALFSYKIIFLLIGRGIQGIGMGAVMTVSRAILRDVFKGKTYVKNASRLASVIAVSPVVFPVFGGYLQSWWGWKANFTFMLVFASMISVCWYYFFPESKTVNNRVLSKPAYAREIGGDLERTNRQESRFAQALAESRGPRTDRVKTGVYTRVHEDSSTESTNKFFAKVGSGKKSNQNSLNIQSVLKNYGRIIRSPIFLKNTLCGGLIYAGEVVFLTIAPFLIQQNFNLSAFLYGWLMFIAIIGFIFGSQASSYLANRLKHTQLILIGLGCCFVAVCFLFVIYFLNIETILSILSPVSFFMFGAGFVYPNTSVGAIGHFPENAGTASALLSSLQGGIAMVATAIIIAVQNNSLATLAISFAVIVLPSCMFGITIFFQEKDCVLN